MANDVAGIRPQFYDSRPMSPSHRYSPPPNEPALSRAERRATGVFYTPPEIIQQIVSLTLAPLFETSPGPVLVLDPACGAGGMLAEASKYGAALFGVDCDPAAVELARRTVPEAEIWCGDALFNPHLAELAPFDAIVANPPYVNIRELAKAQGEEYIQQLRGRFRTARGSFDLYVTFIERALKLLRVGGRCGMIVPNKWAALDYARPLRELLAREASLENVIDLSDARVFRQAAVYPQVLVFRKVEAGTAKAHLSKPETIDVESRVPTTPLGKLATLNCGTPGFAAQRIAGRLLDDDAIPAGSSFANFITSGNIDRYVIRLGNVRYLGRTYARPRLPLDAPELTPGKRKLTLSPKIVVAGLSRRIEAAWDAGGLALGVQVFAASEPLIDPYYLVALLNSKLLSYLFRTRFAAKRLAGGYLSINKGQLTQLPIAQSTSSSGPAAEMTATLAELARRQIANYFPALDDQIDRLVYRLYGQATSEIDEVERHFAALGARAA